MASTVLDSTLAQISYQWLRRGIGTRNLAKMYRIPREEVESLIRQAVTGKRSVA